MRLLLLLVASLTVFSLPVLAQDAPKDEQVYNYSSVLHAYWKLAKPKSYEIFAKSYAVEFPDFASEDVTEIMKSIEKNVEETDLEQTIVIPITLEIGPYVEARQAFVFKPFTADISIPASPTKAGGNLPEPFVRFTNGSRLRSVPFDPETAKKIPGYGGTTRIFAEVRTLPKKASLTSRELKAQITEITLFDASRAELVRLTFDEDTGDLKEAKYLGE
ncbi:MAG: hypothetical protein EBQ96_08505 [Proteobacteria bacterium]|nr:hypothetical protein [Pseudomonadota bacterium]